VANISGNSAGVQVDGPSCVPAKFGLASVAEIEDREKGHWLDGVHYDRLSCDDLLVVSQFCEPHTKTDSASGVDFPESDTFAIIAGYECSAAGDTLAVAWDRAAKRLDQGAARSVERAFWTGQDSAGNNLRQSLGQNPDVVDVTPVGGAVSITDGFAMLESWGGENMACQPILHAARGLGVYLAERNVIEHDGDVMYSRGTGSRVSIGGGYLVSGPDTVAAAAGEGWLFVTGSVKILRAPTFFTPDRDDDAAALDRVLNDVAVFAEREYAILLECGVAAVRVNIQSCC
jgi:hypothetical protein